MPITPYDSIFISSSVSLSLQLPAYHFTQAHMEDHTFHLHKQNKKKLAIFKNPSATIHSKTVQSTHLRLLGDKLCIHLSPY